ncbi:LysR family transcriptional regulator [Pseudomonas sp. 5P_3.1_Bac2]|uniref:LysR family transcriptional regulator n=1 Tax=Pseudomonas sp. 5P_3.1_Bac2 TaxID=2971617 RepID=UPI0021C87914|nr:LysR family transcriptional regulator [Pseudomonas sp. 5P_3.1_Bac2]MCU1716691.1 LysR family transcriptional regulator [Pseudomonas sp. 5P_3.1_Bac2]
MEIKHLRSFVTLAEELHFGRAAQRLAIVQPALSAQIRLLEEELGVRLFERNRHSVTLTEVGKVFLPEARGTLHQAAHAADVAKACGRGEIGTLRLGFVSSVLPELLPTLLRAVRERYPLIQLELKDLPGPDQASALKKGQLDFGLMRLPAVIPGIQTRKLLQEDFVLALPAGHPLLEHEVLEPAMLLGTPVLILARRYAPGHYDQMMQALNALGVQLEVASELGEFTTMLALVSAGMGIGLLPANAARALPSNVLAKALHLGQHKAVTGLAWVDLNNPLKSTLYELMAELFFEAS